MPQAIYFALISTSATTNGRNHLYASRKLLLLGKGLRGTLRFSIPLAPKRLPGASIHVPHESFAILLLGLTVVSHRCSENWYKGDGRRAGVKNHLAAAYVIRLSIIAINSAYTSFS